MLGVTFTKKIIFKTDCMVQYLCWLVDNSHSIYIIIITCGTHGYEDFKIMALKISFNIEMEWRKDSNLYLVLHSSLKMNRVTRLGSMFKVSKCMFVQMVDSLHVLRLIVQYEILPFEMKDRSRLFWSSLHIVGVIMLEISWFILIEWKWMGCF